MISKRLQNIVDLIIEDNNIADIGSDHGYVLVSLRKKGFKSDLLGVENKLAPFKNLENGLKENNILDVNISLSDGLKDVDSKYKTIVIAGMGFDTIKKIVDESKDKLKNIEYFIIDAHTGLAKTRPYFISLGYDIDDERVIFEDSIYYQLIRFKKSSNKPQYNENELTYGPLNLLRKEKSFLEYIQSEINIKKDILSKIPENNEKTNKIIKEIEKLEELL